MTKTAPIYFLKRVDKRHFQVGLNKIMQFQVLICSIIIISNIEVLWQMLVEGSKKRSSANKHLQKGDYRLRAAHSPKQKMSPDPMTGKLFESTKLKSHTKRVSGQSEREMCKFSNKMMTTDESGNGNDSKLHESIFISQHKSPNQEYFQEPLSFKGRKRKGVNQREEKRKGRDGEISVKLDEMKQLVYSQEKQLKGMKTSVTERELNRLIKMHSIQKLRMVQGLSLLGTCKSSRKI